LYLSCHITNVSTIQDPPPWIPATTEDTTAGSSEKAELHMIRAVDTGIINASFFSAMKSLLSFVLIRFYLQLSLSVQESEAKLKMLALVDGQGKT
jgi:hypothetical protein